MQIYRTNKFKKQHKKLPTEIKNLFQKQLVLFFENSTHNSLGIKKMQGTFDVWEMRITKSHRLTFQKKDEVFILRNIGTHDILRKL